MKIILFSQRNFFNRVFVFNCNLFVLILFVLFIAITRSGLDLPVGVYSAISREDVLLSWNDVNLRWIAQDNWTFIKVFHCNYIVVSN